MQVSLLYKCASAWHGTMSAATAWRFKEMICRCRCKVSLPYTDSIAVALYITLIDTCIMTLEVCCKYLRSSAYLGASPRLVAMSLILARQVVVPTRPPAETDCFNIQQIHCILGCKCMHVVKEVGVQTQQNSDAGLSRRSTHGSWRTGILRLGSTQNFLTMQTLAPKSF